MATCEGLPQTAHLPFSEKEVRQLKYCESCGCPFLRTVKTVIQTDEGTGYQLITVKGPIDCRECSILRIIKVERDKRMIILRDTRIDEEKKYKRRGAALAPKGSEDRHIRRGRKAPHWVPDLLKAFQENVGRGLTAKEIGKIMYPTAKTPAGVAVHNLRLRGWDVLSCGKLPTPGKKCRPCNLYSLTTIPAVI